MGKRSVRATAETLRLAEPFRISGYVFETADVVTVTIEDGAHRGRGEGAGVYYLGDDVAHMLAGIEQARDAVEAGVGREELRAVLPPGGARNAIDAALWELEVQQTGRPVWELAGLKAPKPVRTTFTIGADTPDQMAARAALLVDAQAIKLKLTGEIDLDLARVRAVRTALPDIWIGVDGNQGFAARDLPPLGIGLRELRVSLLEQPVARGRESDLDGIKLPLPVAGDESLVSLADIASAPGRFDVINIKLDKCGGLTEGLMMAAEARRLGLGVMVGTMVCTSLGTAPGFVLGQICDLVDLDGPTFLAKDTSPSVTYAEGMLFAGPEVWGSPEAAFA
jgi:L-alanine-DL-glutamate epimerase-like enolase superfamily enzyme